ncbi:MAG: HAD family hydrolase [Nanoarchaeota archaeon]
MIQKISCVGFDLDNTLFKPNAAINERIREYACRRASEVLHQPYEIVRSAFNEHYNRLQSGRRSLQVIGVENVDEIMQSALEKADIVSLLQKDRALDLMIRKLSHRYKLFLITTNMESTALRKLSALGIEEHFFYPKIYELENKLYKRLDGSAFQYVSRIHSTDLSQMLFVGDREETDILPAKKLALTTAIVNATSSHADYQLQNIYQLEEILL